MHSHSCVTIAAIFSTFSSSQAEALSPFSSNYPPPPQPLATSVLLSVPVDLLLVGISYEWKHSVFILLCLAYITEHNVL